MEVTMENTQGWRTIILELMRPSGIFQTFTSSVTLRVMLVQILSVRYLRFNRQSQFSVCPLLVMYSWTDRKLQREGDRRTHYQTSNFIQQDCNTTLYYIVIQLYCDMFHLSNHTIMSYFLKKCQVKFYKLRNMNNLQHIEELHPKELLMWHVLILLLSWFQFDSRIPMCYQTSK